MRFVCLFSCLVLIQSRDAIARGSIDIDVTPARVMQTLSTQKEVLLRHLTSLPDEGILVSQETTAKVDGKTEKTSGLKLCIRKSDCGLFADFSSRRINMYLCNKDYNAMLTKHFPSPSAVSNPSKIDLSKLQRASMSMSSFSKALPKWMDSTYPDSITHTYFSFGGGSIQNQYSAWIAKGGSVSSVTSKTENCIDLVFDDWPTSVGPMTMTVDAEGTIHQMNATFRESGVVYRVEEFELLDGVKIPQKVVLQFSRTNSDLKSETRSSWSKVALQDVGFDPNQFYVGYFGLPEPNSESLPIKDWTRPRFVILALILILSGGVYYAIRRKTS